MDNYVQSIIIVFILLIVTWNIECIQPQGTAIIHNKTTTSAWFIQQESNLQDGRGGKALVPVQTSLSNAKTATFVQNKRQETRDYVNTQIPPLEPHTLHQQKLETAVTPQSSSNQNIQSQQNGPVKNLNSNNRGGARDYVNPQASLVGQTVRPQTPITRGINNRDILNLPTPSTQIVRSNPQINNRDTVRDYVNPSAPLVNSNKNVALSPNPVLPNSYAQAVNPSGLNTNLRNYVAPLRPVPGISKPNFPALPTPPGSQIPIRSGAIQPSSGFTTQISYASKAGGSTTKSPVVIANTPSTGPWNSGSSTTEKPEDGPTDNELREFSEALLNRDVNNAAKYVTINIQGKTTSSSKNDEAPQRLLDIKAEAYAIPTISKLKLLHNNYILDTSENEHVTPQEKAEENDLIDAMLSTPIMQYTKNFLISQNKISKDPKDFKDVLKTIWFSMYSRGGGRVGSSGFEHIFLAEKKNNEISGLHNWIYFDHAELNNIVDYSGYMKKIDLGEKGAIIKFRFKLNQVDKPVDSMFIGTSPELEFALYTTCYLVRADRICPLKLNGHNFIVRAYKIRYRGKYLIGSAFPEI